MNVLSSIFSEHADLLLELQLLVLGFLWRSTVILAFSAAWLVFDDVSRVFNRSKLDEMKKKIMAFWNQKDTPRLSLWVLKRN